MITSSRIASVPKGVPPCIVGVLGDLNAACLATPADLHLRLQHDRVADFGGSCDCFFDRVGDRAGRHGDVEAGKVLLALILKQVQ